MTASLRRVRPHRRRPRLRRRRTAEPRVLRPDQDRHGDRRAGRHHRGAGAGAADDPPPDRRRPRQARHGPHVRGAAERAAMSADVTRRSRDRPGPDGPGDGPPPPGCWAPGHRVEPHGQPRRRRRRGGRDPRRRPPPRPSTPSDLLVLSLTDYAAMYAILAGSESLLRGKTIVNLSSDTPDASRDAAAWAARHGATFLTGGVMVPAPLVGTEAAYVYYSGPADALAAHESTLCLRSARPATSGRTQVSRSCTTKPSSSCSSPRCRASCRARRSSPPPACRPASSSARRCRRSPTSHRCSTALRSGPASPPACTQGTSARSP